MWHYWIRSIYRRDHRKLVIIDEKLTYTGGFNVHDECSQKIWGKSRWLDCMMKTSEPSTVAHFVSLFLDTWNRTQTHKKFTWKKNPEAYMAATHEIMTIRKAVRRSLKAAKNQIVIMYPYFIPFGPMERLLKRKLKQKVPVKIFLSIHSDLSLINVLSFKLAEHLERLGAKIFAYHGNLQNRSPMRFNHSKIFVADQQVGIGSHNFDNRSWFFNLETLVVTQDAQIRKTIIEKIRQIENESLTINISTLHIGYGYWLVKWLRKYL